MRYNASVITARYTSKGTDFKDVAEVYVIYITEFKITTSKKTVCHVESVIKETGEFIDDGLHRVIVNAKIDDGSKAARLMKHFRESDFSDNEFPETSKQIRYYKHTEEGSKAMSSIMEQMMTDYAEEYAEEYAEYKESVTFIENVDKLAKRFNVTTAEACTFLDKTIEDYERAQQIIKKEETEEPAVEFA